MRALLAILTLGLTACSGSSSPVGPSPAPPTASTFTGTVTNTVTGGPVSGWALSWNRGQIVISAPGYVTRETTHTAAVVDLIPEAGFDLSFYRQFARGTLENPAQPLRVLAQAPAIYLQTAGLTAANVAALEATARAVVPALTGGRFQVTTWDTGAEARAPRAGWITVELIQDDTVNCGRATVGAGAGQVWLNTATKCHRDGSIIGTAGLFTHELGHALGFWHVGAQGSLMNAPLLTTPTPSALERHHAAIAYARRSGNLDIDIDQPASVSLAPMVVD